MHAALADPTRLAVVDALTSSDLSASELAARLGTPSNLLAHHLKSLESAGLISRRTSEGDRRRSYYRLHPGAYPNLSTGSRPRPERMLFVCTANTARSHLAAALWSAASDIPATSAGTHPAETIDPRARAAADRRALHMPDQAPRGLSSALTEGAQVVTVCDQAHEELAGDLVALHWSVRDPVAIGTSAAFDEAADDLYRHVVTALAALEPAS